LAVAEKTFALKDYRSPVHNNWCPGCGDFGILSALQQALFQLQIPPHKVAVFSGIGCSGKSPHYLNAFGFHTLHGRSLPNATGGKLVNRDMTVVAVGGDGDGYGIGAGYFVNSGRRNVDFTYLVFDNGVYGLTKGQGAPTLARGMQTKSMPERAIQHNITPVALANSRGYTIVARGYALDVKGTSQLIADAIQHKGSSFIDILQTCPTYNDLQTKEWYEAVIEEQPRMRKLVDEGYNGVVGDISNVDEIVEKKVQAVQKSYEGGTHIPIGVFYQAGLRTYEEELSERLPRYATEPLINWDVTNRDVSKILESFR
jgi:2-oxoglutarate ferredoxin oxidoreductase subunit beta